MPQFLSHKGRHSSQSITAKPRLVLEQRQDNEGEVKDQHQMCQTTKGEFCNFRVGSLRWDVVVNVCTGLVHAGFQVPSLRDATIELFPASKVYMWVKTQTVCVEQRQELAWDLQQKHDKSESTCELTLNKYKMTF